MLGITDPGGADPDPEILRNGSEGDLLCDHTGTPSSRREFMGQ